MKSLFILSCFFFVTIFSFAKHVPIEQALKIGKNFYYERANQVNSVKYNQIVLQYLSSDKAIDPAYYIFNVGNDNGFVIVSSEDITYPILGYSFTGSFSLEKMPPALDVYMKSYAREVNSIKQSTNLKSVNKAWLALNYDSPAKSVKTVQTVGPLLKAMWDQSFPYNAQCPVATSGGDGGHYWVGCVAVAMTQIMKYYNYPQVGTSSTTSYSWANGTTANYTINFAQQSYDWSRMPYTNLAGSVYPDEVAKLMFHAGVAVNMHWGADGSGSQTNLIASALKNYYKYDHSIVSLSKDTYDSLSWNSILKGQLDLGKPIVYSGHPPTGAGHAWDCDGYQDDGTLIHFHQNWGWGGSNNGFFLLNELNTPASPGQPAESLMEGVVVVSNIYPEANYPEFCGSQKLFNSGSGGNFEDGSGNLNYLDNQNCLYLIQPACGNFVHLNFDEFELDPSDVIYIYDGSSMSSPLLATYHGGDIPVVLNSTGNAILVNFVTDGANNSKGWAITYTVDYCKYGMIYTDPFGSFDDGSGTCEYKKSTTCSWTIDLPLAQSITVDITSFSLAQDADFLSVYKNDLSAANLVQKFGYFKDPGATVATVHNPTVPLTILAPKVLLKFFSNSTVNGPGWSVDYSSVISGTDKLEIPVSDINIFPNPFNDDTQISYDLINNSNISLSVTNLLGQELYKSERNIIAGHYEFSLKSIVPNISNGVYCINLKTDKNTITRKIVCTK